MRRMRGWLRRLVGTFSGRHRERELAAELDSHLELHIDDNIRAGMSPEEARRRAILALGGVEQTKQRWRDQRGVPFIEQVLQDTRHAVRVLRKHRGFTATAVIMLALAIGANTAMFAVVYSVLLRPLPYPDADRLVRLSEEHPGGRPLIPDAIITHQTLEAWQEHAGTIEGMAAYASRAYAARIAGETERVKGAAVSPRMFSLLGVNPEVGRFFHPAEAQPGAEGVVVLSHKTWQHRFLGRLSVVGTPLTLDGRVHVIVGVAPAWFYFPDRDAELWTPYVQPPAAQGGLGIAWALARLRPGATILQAESEGTAAARSIPRPPRATLMFGEGGPVQVRVRLVAESMTAQIRPVVLVAATGAMLVLVIACANLAVLLLARGVAQTRELSIRAALGAGRARLVRQMVIETTLLSTAGGIAGVLIASAIIRFLPGVMPPDFPRLDDIRLDLHVLGLAAMASIATAVLAGVLPAMRTTADAQLTSRLASQGADRSRMRLRHALLAVEAALGVMLIVGASLLIRSFIALVSVDAGYNPDNLLVARVYRTAPPDPARSEVFVRTLVERLQAGGGVIAAGAGNMMPFGESSFLSGFEMAGVVDASGQPVPIRALTYIVTPGYAEALGMQLGEGRFFHDEDGRAGAQRIMVSESFARTYLGDGRPVSGRILRGGTVSDAPVTEIVGVVADVRKDALDQQAQPAIYLLHGLQYGILREVNLVVRTEGDPAAAISLVREAVRELDSSATLGEAGPMAAQIARSIANPRLAMLVMVGFATVALLLAAGGLYGVLAYVVTERRREIGVRSALGASPRQLLTWVVGQGLAASAVGVFVGLAAAGLAAPLMRGMLFGVEPADAASFVLAAVVLLLVSAAACLIPGIRAASVSPSEVLRLE